MGSRQLVLQWPIGSDRGFNELVELEEMLIARLSARHGVDGHDMGSGEMNIFVLTDDPLAAFAEARAALSQHKLWADVRVAYRDLDGDQYTLLWPEGQHAFEVR